MSLVDRIAETITRKQKQAESNLSRNFRMFLFPNGNDYTTRLTYTFSHKLQSALDTHFNKIKEFLFLPHPHQQDLYQRTHQTDQQSAKAHQLQPKTPAPKHNLQNEECNGDLGIQPVQPETNPKQQLTHKRKIATQESQQSVQYLEVNTDYNKKKQHPSNGHESDQLDPKTSHPTKQKLKNFSLKPIDRSISHQSKQNHTGLNSQMAEIKQSTIEPIDESSNLDGRKLHHHKSKKTKQHLVKLPPIATQKEKRSRQKEANQKIQAAIDFLNGIQSRKKMGSEQATEWKHQKNEKLLIPKVISSPFNPSYHKLKELAEKYRQDNHEKSSESQHTIMRQSDVTRKRYHRVQKLQRFVLQKPQAYNLYNINMAKHELFYYKIST